MAKIETVETGRGGLGNTKAPVTKQGNQLKKWCFTYNNYKEPEVLLLEERFRDLCSKFVFQKEIGKNGTPHLQGAIWLKKSMRYSELDLPKSIHWEKMHNEKASMEYCQKSDTAQGEVYSMGLPKPIKTILSLYPWQKKIEDLILTEPSDRKIYWYWETVGDVGKSAFVKYLLVKYKKKMCFLDGGKKADLVNLIFNTDMDSCDTCVFDLARSHGGHISYDTLETIKNGVVCNTKYETGFKVFNSPHIIVFANSPPEEPQKLSKDRWVIERIVSKQEEELEESDNEEFTLFGASH